MQWWNVHPKVDHEVTLSFPRTVAVQDSKEGRQRQQSKCCSSTDKWIKDVMDRSSRSATEQRGDAY